MPAVKYDMYVTRDRTLKVHVLSLCIFSLLCPLRHATSCANTCSARGPESAPGLHLWSMPTRRLTLMNSVKHDEESHAGVFVCVCACVVTPALSRQPIGGWSRWDAISKPPPPPPTTTSALPLLLHKSCRTSSEVAVEGQGPPPAGGMWGGCTHCVPLIFPS